jgi:type IX secretion system PorP/SprF family membrane protein
MKYRVNIIVVVLACLVVPLQRLDAQDIHFSQYMHSPLNLNPAETGNFTGDYRFTANHKRQWISFADAYSTFSVSADRSFFPESDIVPSIGFLLNNDVSGDGDFGTLQLILPLSARYQLNDVGLRLGASVGWIQHGFNFNAFYFGNQYTGEQFDPSLPSNELPEADRFSYFDFSVGTMADYRINDSLKLKIGGSAQHLTRPEKSFYQNPAVRLPLRWQVYLSGEYVADEDIVLLPSMLFMNQGSYREFNIGGQVRFDLNPLGLRSIYLGGMFRARDAGILMFGMDYNQLQFHISYDINVSGLTTISRGRGGVEISVIYLFDKLNLSNKPPVRKCPEFI